jgi:hypothetical protein
VRQPFEVLKELNWKVFGLRTYSIGAAINTNIKLQGAFPDELQAPKLEDVSSMVQAIERTRRSQCSLVYFSNTQRLTYAIPLRFGTQNRVHDVLLLAADTGTIPVLAARLNEKYVRATVDKFIERKKQRLERCVQREIISPTNLSQSSQSAFEAFCKQVANELASVTNSHSVTIRAYRAFTDSLDLVAQYASETSIQAKESIQCNPDSSVNAFCYLRSSADDLVYIPDIHNIPEAYRSQGLSTTLRARPTTKSEICLPIGKPPLRLGTLNLESSNFAAYELDIEFLQSMAFYIAQFWKSASSVDDAWWLSQLSLTHLATHELRDFKDTLDPAHRKALEHIVYTISPAEHYHRGGETSWSHLMNFIRRLHNKMAPPETFSDIWRFVGFSETEKISARLLGSLRLIAHAVLSNTRHSDYSRNSITLSLSEHGAGRIVTVEYRSNVSYVDPETLEEIEKRFSTPALSSDGWHFGLFLIGVHARVLGGDIEIDPFCRREVDYAPFCYMVRIPIPEVEHD